MSKVTVNAPHSLDQETAKGKVAVFEEMVSKFGVKVIWSGYTAEIKGMGISGDIAVSTADVCVNLKLGMMAKAAGVKADKLEGSVRKRLIEALST